VDKEVGFKVKRFQGLKVSKFQGFKVERPVPGRISNLETLKR
jgi:hypothetical protein